MERTIATGIDGFTASYPLTDLVPHFVGGHTHDVRLDVTSNDAGKACIYANSGTWIDAHAPESSLTFVSIVPPHEGSDVTVVTTWRFVRGGDPVKLASAAIRVPAP